MPDFVHLHNHTQYSLLDGASNIKELMDKAVSDGMKGLALTDHGNMFGAFQFVNEASKRNLKPIVGCEFYLVADRHRKTFSRHEGDNRYHQLMLAKNATGYANLTKLCSLGYIDGLYSKYPRIDRELIEKYHEGLIATSCCIGAEIPQAILRGQLEEAERLVRWWHDLLGEDYYIELQRHRGMDNITIRDERGAVVSSGYSQEDVNQILIGFARKYGIKTIATNDAHYVEEDDWKPHDILLCVNTGAKISDPVGEGKGQRFAFSSSDYYFKTQEEMGHLFYDVPEALDHTLEVFDKVELLNLAHDIMLPNFPLPEGFTDQGSYLRHLVYEGARQRYTEINEVIRERLDFELHVISDMNFTGYFLIVQDFVKAARRLGVAVGPGRGSAAGSAVAYCLNITNLDPIKYNLYFERFLNPGRVSMPDIDIDFDDVGRQKVIDYVVEKYGRHQVAQIVTFGSMAARSSIRDVGRVLNLPLPDTDRIAKLVPEKPGLTLKTVFEKAIPELEEEFSGDDVNHMLQLREISQSQTPEAEVLQMARRLEGSVRNTGIHPAGIIIAPDDLTRLVPICTTKDADLFVTQFEGTLVEAAGLLKMDFLGLKTLSIIKDAIENIVHRWGEEYRVDPDLIPLDDAKTLETFQKAETTALFQFESEGMQKHLKDLRPNDIEELIAMNALYRPGPMDNIPRFVARKYGREPVTYPHPWLEDILKPTYGIMVYQEQIMEAARIIAGYSLAEADGLRRAMGKKKADEMAKSREKFVAGALEKGVSEDQANEIFDTMARFASYGFNRSHAAAYSVLAFQTGWLKTHYPAEYMAAVLTHNKGSLDKVNFFLNECKRMKLRILGPDVNESHLHFMVNEKGAIRFGLSALKGVGEGPVEAILEEREKNGRFTDIFDFVRRLNQRVINKKVMESLAVGGAFDCFPDIHRAQYFAPSDRYESYLEHLMRFGGAMGASDQSAQQSLFGEEAVMDVITLPSPPAVEPWSLTDKLAREKAVAGIYLSGHPLDQYRLEVEYIANLTIDRVNEIKNQRFRFACVVTDAQHRFSNKGGDMFGLFKVQDYTSEMDIRLFREDYQRYKHLFEPGQCLLVTAINASQSFNQDLIRFQIVDVALLATAGELFTKGIHIHLPLEQLSVPVMDKLEGCLRRAKGPHSMGLMVYDPETRAILRTQSRKYKVQVDNGLLAELEEAGIHYRVLVHKGSGNNNSNAN
ncbi:MAG: DNA polymerase III subunit alpha [Saprospiraceae bacterium]|nr:DNA polymerase III subunit alpha [Saprospiraceae bacterium]